MKIRPATILDTNWIVSQGIEFLKWERPDKPVNEGMLYVKCAEIMAHGFILVAVEKGELVGMIGGTFSEGYWYPDETHLIESFWWVIPESRKSTAGIRLLKEFIKIGTEEGASHIVMSMESISPLNDDAYTKRGFELKSKAFVMEV